MKFLLTCFLLVVNFSIMAQTADHKKLFTDLETQWMNAWKNRDEAMLRTILSNDFTLTSSLSTGALVHKEEWISKAMNNYKCDSFFIRSLDARVYGKTAVLNIVFYQEATANKKQWNGDFLLTDVWVLDNGNWQVVARHASWLKSN